MNTYFRTNLPKEVMAFPGYPFPENLPSFIRHEDVLKYLEDYSQHYDLQKLIKVNVFSCTGQNVSTFVSRPFIKQYQI